MVDPKLAGGPPTMFMCGNHEGAKTQVKAIVTEFGWEIEDLGAVRGGTRDRAALHAVVHPGVHRGPLDARVQGPEGVARLARAASTPLRGVPFTMALLSLNEVSLTFAGPPLLDSVNLQIDDGERLRLLGRNGAGKSTLLKLIEGTLAPDAGTVVRQPRLGVAGLPQEVPLDLRARCATTCTTRAAPRRATAPGRSRPASTTPRTIWPSSWTPRSRRSRPAPSVACSWPRLWCATPTC